MWSATPKNGKTSLFHARWGAVNKKLSKNTVALGRHYNIWQEVCLQITHKTTTLNVGFFFSLVRSKGFPQFLA